MEARIIRTNHRTWTGAWTNYRFPIALGKRKIKQCGERIEEKHKRARDKGISWRTRTGKNCCKTFSNMSSFIERSKTKTRFIAKKMRLQFV